MSCETYTCCFDLLCFLLLHFPVVGVLFLVFLALEFLGHHLLEIWEVALRICTGSFYEKGEK